MGTQLSLTCYTFFCALCMCELLVLHSRMICVKPTPAAHVINGLQNDKEWVPVVFLEKLCSQELDGFQ